MATRQSRCMILRAKLRASMPAKHLKDCNPSCQDLGVYGRYACQSNSWQALAVLLASNGVQGNLVPDAHLAALGVEHGLGDGINPAQFTTAIVHGFATAGDHRTDV
jgi:hypothetical protein